MMFASGISRSMRGGSQAVSKKSKRKQRAKTAPPGPPESPASLFVTVGWSICVLTTFACTVAAGLGEWLLRDRPPSDVAVAIVQVLRFGAVVTAAMSLLLTPVAYRVRREPPPLGFVMIALVVSAVAILAAFR